MESLEEKRLTRIEEAIVRMESQKSVQLQKISELRAALSVSTTLIDSLDRGLAEFHAERRRIFRILRR